MVLRGDGAARVIPEPVRRRNLVGYGPTPPRWEWPDGARISPDGKYVAYEVQTTDWDANDFPTHLRLAVTATGRTYRLTSGKGSSHSPRWSPDGKRLAFTSARTGNGDIYVLTFDTGDLKRVTFDDSFEILDGWSRDGRPAHAGQYGPSA